MPKAKTNAVRPLFGSELLPGALSAELIGTFILTTAVLVTSANVLVVAIAIMVLLLAFASISGGHFNPITTVALFATKQISWVKAFGYIVAQLLGAMLALIVVNQFLTSNTEAAAAGIEAFKVRDLVGEWVPVFAELLGGLIFGLGVAAAYLGKKQGYDAAFTVGGALLVALVIATLGSAGVVNPAVALGASAYTTTNWWTVGVYAVAPVVGGVAGAWLYKLMQWDVDNAGKGKKK